MITSYDKAQQSTSSPQPWDIVQEQLKHLDRSLTTVPPKHCEEADLARMYIIGQIHALKWAIKLWEV